MHRPGERCWDLAHHVDLEPALTLPQPVLLRDGEDALALLDSTTNGIMRITLVRPMSRRTLTMAAHSRAKPSS